MTVALGEDVQAAVDRCPSGGSVLLLPGAHKGPLALGPRVVKNGEGQLALSADKEVHVFGRGRATLWAATCSVLTSCAALATTEGLLLRQDAGNNYTPNPCVRISGGGLRLQACDVASAQKDSLLAIVHGADPVVSSCRWGVRASESLP